MFVCLSTIVVLWLFQVKNQINNEIILLFFFHISTDVHEEKLYFQLIKLLVVKYICFCKATFRVSHYNLIKYSGGGGGRKRGVSINTTIQLVCFRNEAHHPVTLE